MSNNSLPHVPSGIDLKCVADDTKSIVHIIQDKIIKYLKSPNGYDPDNRLPKLRLTSVRLYLNNLVKLLRENCPSEMSIQINQLNFILHSHIINGIAYDFPERLYKVLHFLHQICEENDVINKYVKLWDSSVIYF
jgi:hypothetical protein